MTLAQTTAPSIPFLESGDRLTRPEFERRYKAMPDCKKAELIEGRVYMASPVRARKHGRPHAAIIGWLYIYWATLPGLELLDNATIRLDNDNEPQPDGCLRLEENYGGQSRVSTDDYIEGAPELIVEIAASTASYDLHEKKEVYRRHGVKEYLVWRVVDRSLDWFRLQDGDYILVENDADGLIRSEVFPGLWLAVTDLLADNQVGVIAGLNQGLASSEFDIFRQSLLANSINS
jgi:Uma2 family endonuclease